MERILDDKCNPREMSTAALAFIGDAVYGLMVRERICCAGRHPVGAMHSKAVKAVRCEGQSLAMESLLPLLSDDERAVFMRGRNTHTAHVPKNSEVADYRCATGLEALFGYIYLCGNIERLRELFAYVEVV